MNINSVGPAEKNRRVSEIYIALSISYIAIGAINHILSSLICKGFFETIATLFDLIYSRPQIFWLHDRMVYAERRKI